jgi:hypothetical protein
MSEISFSTKSTEQLARDYSRARNQTKGFLIALGILGATMVAASTERNPVTAPDQGKCKVTEDFSTEPYAKSAFAARSAGTRVCIAQP